MKSILIALMMFSLSAFAGKATVTKIIGDATYLGKTLVKGEVLPEGSEVTLMGMKSLLQITFDDKSRILLREGVYKIEKSMGPDANILTIVRGVLFSDKAKVKSSLEIRTKNAVMGIRGTKFYVEVGSQTYLCVCEGQVEISNSKGKALVKKGEDITLGSDSIPTVTKANQMMSDMAWSGFKEME